jgi:hypothetical protein
LAHDTALHGVLDTWRQPLLEHPALLQAMMDAVKEPVEEEEEEGRIPSSSDDEMDMEEERRLAEEDSLIDHSFSEEAPPPVKRKRGRPLGSKNRPREEPVVVSENRPSTEEEEEPNFDFIYFYPDIIRRRVRVWWPRMRKWYDGVIQARHESLSGKFIIHYDDGEVRAEQLFGSDHCQWKFLNRRGPHKWPVRTPKRSRPADAEEQRAGPPTKRVKLELTPASRCMWRDEAKKPACHARAVFQSHLRPDKQYCEEHRCKKCVPEVRIMMAGKNLCKSCFLG